MIPAGVTTATVTFGKVASVLGEQADVTVVIEPSHDLVWEATGDVVGAFNGSAKAAAGTIGQLILPHTDQAGFRTKTGQTITDWYYTAHTTATLNGAKRGWKRVFSIPSDVTTLDLDLLPTDGQVMAPGIGTWPEVTSVNGKSGAVIVEGGVPSDAELAGMFTEPDTLTGVALRTTIGAEVGPVVGPLVAQAIADDDTIVQTVNAAVAPAVDATIANRGVVTGQGIGRIIVSSDPDYPLEEGDLLVLLEIPRYFTDFTEHPTGQAPAGWSQPWVAGAYAVSAVADATGGKALKGPTSGGNARRLLKWDALDSEPSPDVEVLYRWRNVSENGQFRVVLRASGTAAAESGYWVGPNAGAITIGRFINGATSTVRTSNPINFAANVWHTMRVRIEGANIMVRTWVDGALEPETWWATVEDTAHANPGWVGIMQTNAIAGDHDIFSVAFDGGTARGPVA